MCKHNDRVQECRRCHRRRIVDSMAAVGRAFATVEQAARRLLAGLEMSGYETKLSFEVIQIAIDFPVSPLAAKAILRSLDGNIAATRKLCELSDLGYSQVQICAAARGIAQAPSSAPIGR